MSRIKADVAALRQNATTIQQQITELQSLNSSLESLLGNIEGSWEGAASDKYIATMREHKQKAENMVSVLAEFKSYIESAANRLEAKDNDGASRISGC